MHIQSGIRRIPNSNHAVYQLRTNITTLPIGISSTGTLDFPYLVCRLATSESSFSCMWTGGRITIWFHGTKTVLVRGLKGDLWNWRVTAPPPFTSTSNLKGKDLNRFKKDQTPQQVSRQITNVEKGAKTIRLIETWVPHLRINQREGGIITSYQRT